MSGHMDSTQWRIAIIGYGEVGRILAEDLRAQGLEVAAYDIKLSEPTTAQPMHAHALTHGVRLCQTAADALALADLVICAVTASQTVLSAKDCAPALRNNSFYLDFNSASPTAKQCAADVVNQSGGRYVEAAVMTSVPPYRIKVPLLLGGEHATALSESLSALGFSSQVVSDRLGVASATKMCRSVMIKGLEAMVIESLTSARHYGVEDAVLASLAETFPAIDWERQAAYFFQRAIEHGRRRSEEMVESAQSVADAGLTPWSASATAERHAWVAQRADEGWFGARGTADFARSSDWRHEADRILAGLQPAPK